MRENIFGMNRGIIEFEGNNVASQYMEDNYERLIQFGVRALKLTVPNAEDLVDTVYLSIVKDERNGEGFDMSKTNKSSCISVETFILNRMSLYSKSVLYRLNPREINIELYQNDESGRIDRKQAHTLVGADEICVIDNNLSIFEEMKYILTFEGSVNLNLRYFLKNLEKIGSSNIDKSLFAELRNMVKYHNELGDALKNVIEFSANNREDYLTMVNAI